MDVDDWLGFKSGNRPIYGVKDLLVDDDILELLRLPWLHDKSRQWLYWDTTLLPFKAFNCLHDLFLFRYCAIQELIQTEMHSSVLVDGSHR